MLDHELIRHRIYPLLDKLTPRQRQVLILRFGLFDTCFHLQREIAVICDVTQQAVSKTIILALQNLHAFIRVERFRPQSFIA